MKKTLIFASILLLATALGCVIRTEHRIDAHITLDIRHIADQAESVLDFVEGKTDVLPGMESAPEPVSYLDAIWSTLSPIQVAHADTLKVTTSPLVVEIATKMRERNSEIVALKQQGCLGETNRGLVELRECEATRDADQRNAAQKVVAEENKDRTALYNEIARLNRETPDVNVAKVQAIYAMERLRRAQPGEIFQMPPAGSDFDAVKKSALGQKLGDQCQPGAWVRIP